MMDYPAYLKPLPTSEEVRAAEQKTEQDPLPFFPETQVQGSSWILDVLDDLMSFSDDRGLSVASSELRRARLRIAAELCSKGELNQSGVA